MRSLLLGGAAALVAVSGARAADAVVAAAPEPMEYVRVCDVYGSGFYYMPGTETCLKVSGYVRVDLAGGDYFANISNSGDETYANEARFALRVDARSETELGTLRAYAELTLRYEGTETGGVDFDEETNEPIPFNTYDNEDTFAWEHIYIELGGFRIGKTDSMFSTFTDYASGVYTDDIGVPYGPFGTLQMAYTYTGANGFSAALALEQGDEDEYDGGITEDYAPYVVGGVSMTQGWGKVGLVAGWDTWQQEVAIKGRVDFNITEAASVFVMAAWDSGGDEADGDDPNGVNFYAPWQGDWGIWGGTAITINDKTTFNAQVGYDDGENFGIAANVEYELVPDFTIAPEVVYADNFDDDAENPDNDDQWGLLLRFQRNF